MFAFFPVPTPLAAIWLVIADAPAQCCELSACGSAGVVARPSTTPVN
jgi:hypothetical protein